MFMESLKLNDGKTEFLIIGTLQQLEKFDIPFVRMWTQFSYCGYYKTFQYFVWLQGVHGKVCDKDCGLMFPFSFFTTYDVSGNTSLKSQLMVSFMPL